MPFPFRAPFLSYEKINELVEDFLEKYGIGSRLPDFGESQMAEEVPRYFKKPSCPKGLFLAFRCLEVEAITQKVRGLILSSPF